jgi:serine/threonine protein kinase
MQSRDSEEKAKKAEAALLLAMANIGRLVADRWVIVEVVGETYLGTLFKACEQTTRKVIALKQIKSIYVDAVSDLSRFEERVQAYVALNHEHIANFYDIHFDANGDVFLFCDHFESESLDDVLSKVGHISIERAVKIFEQAADGLDYAHRQKILHRDLRTANICLVNDQYSEDDVRITDFGIASLLNEDSETTATKEASTQSNEAVGSYQYKSPEQCAGKRIDQRSDIYSLGCIMHESVSGKPPFIGRNMMETAYKHMNEAPPPLAVTDLPIDRNFDRYQLIVSKALQKEVERRYQSMAELGHDLALMLEASESKWKSSAYCLQVPSKTVAIKKRQRRIPWKLISMSIGITFFLCLLVYWSFNLLTDDAHMAQSPRFDPDRMWVVKEKRVQPTVEDFAARLENSRIASATLKEKFGQHSLVYAKAQTALSRLLLNAGLWDDAENELRKLIDLSSQISGQLNLAEFESNLALCYFMRSQNDQAEKYAKLSLQETSFPKSAESLAARDQALNILGDIYTQRGATNLALDTYLELYALDQAIALTHPATRAKVAARLADAYRRVKNFKESERLYLTAMDIWRNYVAPTGEFMAKCKLGYALALADVKMYKQSQDQLRQAIPIAIEYSNPRSDLVRAMRSYYLDNLFYLDLWKWVQVKVNPDADPLIRSPGRAATTSELVSPSS